MNPRPRRWGRPVEVDSNLMRSPRRLQRSEINLQRRSANRDGDVAKQNVLVVDDDSNVWAVVYELVRQPDGSWLINGCVVIKSDVLEA
jgi:hypothetical protein